MCGIFGYHGKLALSNEVNQKILRSIEHRGPDDSGIYKDETLLFAHTRLSIVDVSSNGHQPMISTDQNFIIIFNGEIYNHKEIRNDLFKKGYEFKSSSDTETLLYGYIEYGEEICKQLNGIFAFAILDKKNKTVFIARDHFGTKPLYYYNHNETFCFGSEIKSFLNIPNFDKEINISAFPFYAQMMYAPGINTPFKHVLKLLPGYFMKYSTDDKKLNIQQFFEIDYSNINYKISEKEWINNLDIALSKAVSRQLMSDVPVGSFLSGGLDSSLITTLASKIYKLGEFNAFTISSNEQFYDEGFDEDEQYATKVAEKLGIKLHRIPADFNIIDDFDKMIWHLDEPQGDPAPLLVYKICKAARNKGIKVLLSGTAGDDIFTGYRRHQALAYEKYFKFITPELANAMIFMLNKISKNTPFSRRLTKLIANTGSSKYNRWASYFSWLPQSEVLSLFNADAANEFSKTLLPEEYYVNLLNSLPDKTNDINKMLFLEMKTFLPDHNLNYTDKMSMATGVEVRVPYLGQALVNFVNTIPPNLKMKGSQTKYILKKVAEKHLSNDIIYRNKTGFGAPIRNWIKNDMKEMVHERLTSSNLNKMGLFNYKAVENLIKRNEEDEVDASYTIWSLLSMESWQRQFLE